MRRACHSRAPAMATALPRRSAPCTSTSLSAALASSANVSISVLRWCWRRSEKHRSASQRRGKTLAWPEAHSTCRQSVDSSAVWLLRPSRVFCTAALSEMCTLTIVSSSSNRANEVRREDELLWKQLVQMQLSRSHTNGKRDTSPWSTRLVSSSISSSELTESKSGGSDGRLMGWCCRGALRADTSATDTCGRHATSRESTEPARRAAVWWNMSRGRTNLHPHQFPHPSTLDPESDLGAKVVGSNQCGEQTQ